MPDTEYVYKGFDELIQCPSVIEIVWLNISLYFHIILQFLEFLKMSNVYIKSIIIIHFAAAIGNRGVYKGILFAL